MFKFKGISSNDMQVVIEEEEHFIARASQRYEITEIEGKDGAIFDELGYSIVERPIYVQCLNINKIDDILAWLNGEGEFEYKGRKTTARFYSQLEPQRSSCIRIIDTTFIRDPFWNKANEDYQLVKDRKDKQASGEYIHVEDSSNCRAKIGIGGNQEQETREGYNKLNMSNAKGGTSGGITCVINKDGSYQFKGTATTTDNGTVNVWFLGYYNSEAPTLFTLEAGTYYINDVSLFSGIKQLNKPLTKIYTFTSEVNITGVRAMSATPGQTYNEVKYPIIAKSNKELTWEQYGVSPSPDYQSPVKTVGSNVNYYNKETEEIGFVLSDGSLQPNNTVWTHSDFIEVNSNEIISITCENKANGQFAIVEYDKNKKFLKHNMCNYVNTEPNNKFTITTTSTTKYVIGAYRNDSNMNNIMVVKGAEVLPYNPNCNGMGTVKVTKCNKNISKLLGKDSYWQYTSRGIKNMGRNNGTRILEFELKKGQKVTIGLKLFSKPIKSTTFTIYLNGETNSQFLNINEYALNQIYKKEYTVTEDSLIEIRNWGNENSETYEFQLWAEIGSLTDYIQHEEQSYIMPVQKEMLTDDFFDWDNEEEVHGWTKLVLTGNENWKLESTGRFGIMKSDLSEIPAAASSDNDYLGNMCNSYKESTPALTWKKEQGFCVDGTSCLRIYDDKYSTNNDLEGFKTYLKSKYDAGTPVVIYYKLATSNRLKFTDEQKAVAKELNNARTYKNVTNITTDSKAKLSLDYFTVTDETIKNEGNIQSRPVLRLEKTVSEAVEITINNVRFKYNFNNDTYVEIDCENKTVEYEGINRNRNLFISYDFPKLNIGSNNIIMNDGDCIIKVIRKDRWL